MLVLVANLGSTSFKFKLLDMERDGEVIARGGYERIGQPGSPHKTHADVIDQILKDLPSKPEAIGFKAVHGGPISGAVRVTDDVIHAIEHGKSVANSLGLTPQTGVFHNNRVGDFDVFALQRLTKHGYSVDDVLKTLGKEGGLLGISGVSNDMRDVEREAASGNERAKLAVDAFVESVRHYPGAYPVAPG